MAAGLLKQPQWGSGARAHKQIQRCSACLCCALVSCAGYGLQEGMSQYYYSNSGEKKKQGTAEKSFQLNEGPKNKHLNEGPKIKHLNEGPINKQGLGTSKNKQHGICFVPKLKAYRHI